MNKERRHELAEYAHNLRLNMTWAEKRLWYSFLASYPIPFVAQKVIGNYIVDFYCNRVRLSIEIDGDSHYEARQMKYDRTRTTFLEMMEIKELRFTNLDIRDDFESVCEIIHNEVNKRRNDVHDDGFQKLLSKH